MKNAFAHNAFAASGGISQTAADARYVLKAAGSFTGLTGAGFRDTSAAFDVTMGFTSSTVLDGARSITWDVKNASHQLKFTAASIVTFPSGTVTLAQLGANTFTDLQTITQGTANAGILAATGYSLTGSNATSMIDLAGTWNTSGTPTALKLNITDTASNAASKLLDLQVSGSSKFAFSKAGTITVPAGQGLYSAGNLYIGSNGTAAQLILEANSIATNGGRFHCSWGGYLSFGSGGAADVFVRRKDAATIQLGEDAAGVTNQMITAASRITSDGVGADLTIAAGNGRGAAGGSLILGYYTTAGAATIGTLAEAVRINTLGQIVLTDLPTSDPGVFGALYRTAGSVMISI